MHNLALVTQKGYKVTGSDDFLNHLNHVWIKKGICL
jgi:hypothetical protein